MQSIPREIVGLDSTGRRATPVPNVFGMNFQSVSVGQRLAKSGLLDAPGLTGGYLDANATPGAAMTLQLAFVDNARGRMVAELKANGIADQTLIIVGAKHGQSPIDLKQWQAVSDASYTETPGYGFHIADDVGVVWLAPETAAAARAAASEYLLSQTDTLKIAGLAGRDILRNFYQDPATDSRTPDIITVSQQGAIYTGGSKLSEHGGFADDDRNGTLLVSAPSMKGSVVTGRRRDAADRADDPACAWA